MSKLTVIIDEFAISKEEEEYYFLKIMMIF